MHNKTICNTRCVKPTAHCAKAMLAANELNPNINNLGKESDVKPFYAEYESHSLDTFSRKSYN